MAEKITVDSLTEKQMKEVRKYLGQLPNKPHQAKDALGFTQSYGNYVEVTVDKIDVLVDPYSARSSLPVYSGVTFFVPKEYCIRSACGESYDNSSSFDKRQLEERMRFVKGLVSLLGSFVLRTKR